MVQCSTSISAQELIENARKIRDEAVLSMRSSREQLKRSAECIKEARELLARLKHMRLATLPPPEE
jgi:hypothetical protein